MYRHYNMAKIGIGQEMSKREVVPRMSREWSELNVSEHAAWEMRFVAEKFGNKADRFANWMEDGISEMSCEDEYRQQLVDFYIEQNPRTIFHADYGTIIVGYSHLGIEFESLNYEGEVEVNGISWNVYSEPENYTFHASRN